MNTTTNTFSRATKPSSPIKELPLSGERPTEGIALAAFKELRVRVSDLATEISALEDRLIPVLHPGGDLAGTERPLNKTSVPLVDNVLEIDLDLERIIERIRSMRERCAL